MGMIFNRFTQLYNSDRARDFAGVCLGPQGRLGTGGSVHACLHNFPKASQPDLPTSGLVPFCDAGTSCQC